MKIQGFCSELRKLSGRAKQRLRKWMKCQEGDYCPITQVAKSKLNTKYSTDDYEDAAYHLRLDDDIVNDIVAAADCLNGDLEDLTKIQKQYHKLMTNALKDTK